MNIQANYPTTERGGGPKKQQLAATGGAHLTMSEAKPTSQYLRKKVAQINMTNAKPTSTTNGGHQTLN